MERSEKIRRILSGQPSLMLSALSDRAPEQGAADALDRSATAPEQVLKKYKSLADAYEACVSELNSLETFAQQLMRASRIRKLRKGLAHKHFPRPNSDNETPLISCLDTLTGEELRAELFEISNQISALEGRLLRYLDQVLVDHIRAKSDINAIAAWSASPTACMATWSRYSEFFVERRFWPRLLEKIESFPKCATHGLPTLKTIAGRSDIDIHSVGDDHISFSSHNYQYVEITNVSRDVVRDVWRKILVYGEVDFDEETGSIRTGGSWDSKRTRSRLLAAILHSAADEYIETANTGKPILRLIRHPVTDGHLGNRTV